MATREEVNIFGDGLLKPIKGKWEFIVGDMSFERDTHAFLMSYFATSMTISYPDL